MSKKWYPVIDVTECIECGACIDKCKNGVFDKTKYPSPYILNPDNCKDGCHGCANLCPSGAIEYVGEGFVSSSSGCGCSCNCGEEK